MTLPRHHFRLERLIRREDGAMTIFGLFLIATMIAVGGIGLDYSNAIMARTQLQVAADAAAHAAIVTYDETKSETAAKQMAIRVASTLLPISKFGTTIEPDDIRFGRWDATKREFDHTAVGKTAVWVNTQRLAERSNPVGTYFLKFVGVGVFDVRTASIFETYYPTCFLEGFVAENFVDVQSNNTYGNGFCIHSNDHVELNNHNTFMDGTIVSMPDRRDIVLPSGGWDSNPGLSNAIRDGAYRLGILSDIDDIMAGAEDPDSAYFRTDYVDIDPLTSEPKVTKTLSVKSSVNLADWEPGAVHYLTCASSKKKIGFGKKGDVFNQGVLITNCIIQFGQVELHDVVIVSSNDDDTAFSASAGFQVGKDDSCTPGGGAQLITRGGMNFPANLQVYGGQLIAEKTISFAARPNGIEGVSMMSGDSIDGSSLINVGFCGGLGMDNNYMAAYFRLAG